MKPNELAQHLSEATGAVERHEVAHDELSVWVANDRWVDVAKHLHTCGKCRFDYFTFLTAVDQEQDGFEIVCHVYSVPRQHHINLKTVIAREGATVPTLSGVWRGANWHERETWELFGIVFDGHPHLVKLLLPTDFDGFPLRKEFLLTTREVKEWPGAKEPEEHKA